MEKSADTSEKRHKMPIYGLDIVRFVAAMLVVVYHLAFKAFAIEGGTLNKVIGTVTTEPPGWWFSWLGWLGVQVFFVVSGAVIAYSVQSTDALSFALRRFARLFPALLIAIVIALPVSFFIFEIPLNEASILAAKNLIFLPVGPWLLGQFWTIPIELSFYAVIWALICTNQLKNGLRILPWILGVGSATFWINQTFDWYVWGGRIPELLLLSHGAYFALGMLCAKLGSNRLSFTHYLLIVLCLLSVILQLRTAAAGEMYTLPYLADYWLHAFAVWLVLMVWIALSFHYQVKIASLIGRYGSFLRVMGLATYPLYLTHIHIGGALVVLLYPTGLILAQIVGVFVSVAASVAIAMWLEPPLYKAVSQILNQVEKAGRSALRSA